MPAVIRFVLILISLTCFFLSVLRIRISDPGSNNRNKRGGRKKFVVLPFCSHKYHKLFSYFIFDRLIKNFSQLTKDYSAFDLKNWHKDLENMGLGSRIRKKTYSGSQTQESKRHRILVPDPQHCFCFIIPSAPHSKSLYA